MKPTNEPEFAWIENVIEQFALFGYMIFASVINGVCQLVAGIYKYAIGNTDG